MNKLKYIIVFFAILFQSCSANNDPDKVVVEKPSPSNLTIKTELFGKTGTNPNGDGSGKMTLKIEALNANKYEVQIEGKTIELTTGSLDYNFTVSGTNSYEITASAYNTLGKAVSKTIWITIFVTQKLIWSDEFDVDGAPNDKNWNYDLGNGNGWGNNELEYYTNRPENVSIKNGILNINLIKEAYMGSQYTSTRMLTKGKFSFKYGKFEVRAKLPKGGGTWPAFWLLGDNLNAVGWPACGEIDILESVGNKPDVIHSSLHSPGRSGNTPDTATITIPNTTEEFHVYGAEWTAKSIKFYVDDKVFYTFLNNEKFPFNDTFFIILNCAMGGNFGGAVDPNFTNATYQIDYVRVYN